MFDSEECWPHHVTNEYTKTTTIIIQSALVINRILVTINSQKYSKSSCGLILSVATLIVSGVVTVLQHYRGPFKGMQTTSCFRESDIVLDLRTKTYDIMSEYMRKESIISTISVTIIGTIQLISFCTYDAFLSIFAKISEKNASEHDTNVIGWFYTGPFNAIISPSAVLVYIYWIRKNRKNQIKKMTTMKDNHFQQMSVMWK
uniref:G_PROTEIN_RECEP_F1_2 domain-containing protein n=1 Tax=Caenorhabditis tropicalis TaxID=1561998 RepID=A0A1I7V1A8_9PELO